MRKKDFKLFSKMITWAIIKHFMKYNVVPYLILAHNYKTRRFRRVPIMKSKNYFFVHFR